MAAIISSMQRLTEHLTKLRCPVTKSMLSAADAALVARLNAAIAAGTLLTRISNPVTEPVEAGLINDDRTLFYRVDADVLTLLASEAIEIWEHVDTA